MPDSSIWVLIASENEAAICSSQGGTSQLLRTVTRADTPDWADMPSSRQRTFALQLMSELFRGAKNGAYDGIILIAAEEMLAALREIALPEFRQRLVGEIPRTPDALPFFIKDQMPAWETLQ